MKQVILDTNFILSCIKQKIDFFEDIKFMGLKILIPTQVLNEIKRISNSRKKLNTKNDAKIALKLLDKNLFEERDLDNKYVDKALIKFSEKNRDIIIASLDKKLKEKIENPKLVIRGKKKLAII